MVKLEMSKGGGPEVLCPSGQGAAHGCGAKGKSSPPCSWRAVGLGDGQEAVGGSAEEPGLTPSSHRGYHRDEES